MDGQSTMRMDDYGTQKWFNSAGQYHRTDGPALVYADGASHWMVNGIYHRTDGPAIEGGSTREWLVDGKRHRMDGPAYEGPNGMKSWFIHGEPLTEAEFKKFTKLFALMKV